MRDEGAIDKEWKDEDLEKSVYLFFEYRREKEIKGLYFFFFIFAAANQQFTNMKQTLYFLFVFALLTGTACSSGKKNSADGTTADSTAVNADSLAMADKTDYSQFYNKPEKLDTVIGDWEIHVHQFYDGTSFKEGGNVVYANYPMRINIKKGGKTVVENRIITYKTLLGEDLDKTNLLSFWRELFVTETTVYIDVSCCPTESDAVANYLLAFSADGKDSKYYIVYALSSGDMDLLPIDVSTFYAMYAHELAQTKPNPKAIKKVLNKYCTKTFANELLPHTLKNNPLFATPRFSPAWVNTLEIDTLAAPEKGCTVTYTRSPGDGKKVVRALKLKDPDDDRYLFDGVEEPGKAVAWEE